MVTKAEAQAARDRQRQQQGTGTSAPASGAYTLLRDLRPNLKSNEIVRDLIPRRAFGEVHAEAGGGKTAIIADLLMHVAAGLEYRGRRVERQPVVYCALEGHSGIGNRVIAAAREIGVEDVPFALVTSGDNFRDPATAQRVAAICKELVDQFGGDCPIVAIDTYTAALAGGSDCDPRDVGAFIRNVQRHLLTAATVLICHHFGKDAARGGRGWSGLNAALDFELEIERSDDLGTMRITKARDGSDQQAAFCYRLTERELGVNEHGEPVTAVVVEHLADEDTAKRGRRLSPKARAALNVLWECIKDSSRSYPMADRPGHRCVMLGVWEKACIMPGAITKATAEKERRRKFREAKAELEEQNAVVCDGATGERVYPAPKLGGGDGGNSDV